MTAHVVSVLDRVRLLPVAVIDAVGHAELLSTALVGADLPVVEVALRTPAALDAIKMMASRDDLHVGAGTVLSAGHVDAAVSAGASFAVSPGLDREVIVRCQERGILPVPGVSTASEVMAARSLGLTTLKFFPAGLSGGPAAIEALSHPFPDVRFVPTGGIAVPDLGAYFALPSVLAVGGSWMVQREPLVRGDVERLTSGLQTARATAAAWPAGHRAGSLPGTEAPA